MKQISLCITTYNRCDMTIECFLNIMSDERIGEIIIVDDASDIEIYNELESICKHLPKVKLYRNEFNINCYLNKMKSIELSSFDWVAILDSDNIFNKDYLDAIYNYEPIWDDKIIYAPTFAKVNFDYREFSGKQITKENINEYWERPMFQTALNTSNYFFNKNEFLKHFDTSVNPITSEALFTNYNWLNAGNSILFVPEMCYEHRVHPNSHYILNNHKTVDFNISLIEKYKQLK